MPRRPVFDLQNYSRPDEFGKWLGFRLLKLDRKKYRAEVGLKVRKSHLSPAGRVHGGVISALFDAAFGAATFTTLQPRDFTSTVELKVNYLRSVELGDELLVKTRVVFRGKRLCVLTGEVLGVGGKKVAGPIAIATATFNIVSPPAA